jgi:hypothetical protein
MTDHASQFEMNNDDMADVENDTPSGEGTQRLQLMIAYLLEKNEELRMQLESMGSIQRS